MTYQNDYIRRLFLANEKKSFPAGSYSRAEIFHEDDCPFQYGKGGCRCSPDIKVTINGEVFDIDDNGDLCKSETAARGS